MVMFCALGACGTTTPSHATQQNLQSQAATTLSAMTQRDPGLPALLSSAAGYAVFPDVGAAGALLAGGAFGKGILYEQGRPTGYVELKQASVGPQLGGQTYAELVVLRNPNDVEDLKGGVFKMGANMSAVILKTGAAAAANFESGISVFVMPRGGMMAGVSVHGQKIGYRPLTAMR
jgi:lipid-binding SYLF domain-containing protein